MMDETCDNCGKPVDGFAYLNQNGMCQQCWADAYDDEDDEPEEYEDGDEEDEDLATDQCPECGDEVGQAEIEDNCGVCDNCADTVDEEDEDEE